MINHCRITPPIFAALLLTLSACGGGGDEAPPPDPGPNPGPTPTSATVSIGDDRIADEGSDGGVTAVDFTVSLDAAAAADVSVSYSIVHVTTEDNDFNSSSGNVTITAGNTDATIAISAVADTAFELNEEFTVLLSSPSSNATIGKSNAAGQLVNDDAFPLVIDIVYLGAFDAVLDGRTFEFDYDLLFDVADMLAGLGVNELNIPFDVYYQSDIHLPFFVASGNLRILVGGGNSGTIRIVLPAGFDGFAIGGNFLLDFDWSAVFDGLPTATWEILTTIEPQDVEPTVPLLGVSDVSVFNEGDAGTTTDMTFVATLSEPLAEAITLDYATIDSSATAPQDYVATSGSVTIAAGDTRTEFVVTANGDDEAEGTSPELFIVSLIANTDAAFLNFPWATGIIYDDDTSVDIRRISIQNAALVEGDSGTSNMELDVVLDDPAVTPVTFRFATRDDTAEAGTDYETTTDEMTFQPGESRLVISVPVFGDTDPEDDETFIVAVTQTFGNGQVAGDGVATILTDDPIARVNVASIALAEGDSGDTVFEFVVTLNEPLDDPLDIDFISNDVTATAGDDYINVDSSLTIPAGQTDGRIEVIVTGDTVTEDDEVFEIAISTTSPNALVVTATVLGTILNDDGAGGWSGEELVHQAGVGVTATALRPQVGFGSGSERHVIYLQDLMLWHTVSSARGVWTAPESVAPVDSMIRPPGLVVDAVGNAITALPNAFLESHSFDSSSGWLAEALPLAVESGSALDLAGDPGSGEAVVVWREPPNSANNNAHSIWAASFEPGIGWQNMDLVETIDVATGLPDVAVAANGDAITVFAQPPAAGGTISDVVAYRRVGASWEGPTILDSVDTETASSPRIDINAAGNAAAVWYQPEPVASGIAQRSIYISRYDATSGQWSAADLVENETDFATRDPDVAIDADGNVFVVWLQISPNFNSENLLGNRYDAATDTWSGPQLLELDDTADGMPIISQQVVADDLGNAIVVWIQNDVVLQNLRSARYSADDGAWQPSELLEDIDTGDANIPTLVIDRASGNAMVVWHHSDGFSTNIWANRYTN